MKSYLGIDLAGRTAFITGAGSGIGRGAALALAAAGANVMVTARRIETGEETANLIRAEGGSVAVAEADATRRDHIEAALNEAARRFGGVDIVIHNAVNKAVAKMMPLHDFTQDRWNELAPVALDGAIHCAQAALPWLRKSGARGRFILIGSALGLHGSAHSPMYSALKGAYRGLVKSLAREWGEHGITVNWIAPSSLVESTDRYFQQNPGAKEAMLRGFPMGRMGRPREDVGGSLLAICSEAFGYVTGQTIQVDGGLYTAI